MYDVIFRDIVGFPGYCVSNIGDVWSCRDYHGGCSKEWIKLRPRFYKDGYPIVTLRKDRIPYTKKVCHLVLETFVGPRQKGMEARHFPDPSPSNNRADNLGWCSHQDNINDKITMGTIARGERHGNSKLVQDDINELRRLRGLGMTYKAIGEKLGISAAHAHSIFIGKYWSHI